MIAIIAALPQEIAGLVRGERADAACRDRGIALYRLRSAGAVVVAGGMGADRVALAVEAALQAAKADGRGRIETLISVGLAGSCTAALRAGAVVAARQVVDARTGERFETVDSEATAVLVTADRIASVAEKKRLAASYGAGMVDMEAATVARLAQAHGIGFRAIKAISDAHDFELESVEKFTGERGQFRTAAFALHIALRPGQWPMAMELGKNSKAALDALTKQLWEIMAAARKD